MADQALPDPPALSALHATANFLIDSLAPPISDLDHTDVLLLIAVIQANVAHITAEPILNARFGPLAAKPMDEDRREVSMHAVAASLGIAFETARRRIHRLAEQDYVTRTQTGVRVLARNLAVLQHDEMLPAHYRLARRLYRSCRGLSPSDDDAASGDLPYRSVARIAHDHLLRVVPVLIRAFGDLVEALVWMALLRESVVVSMVERESRPGATPALRLAKTLGLPPSNVRRKLRMAEMRGLCERRPAGYHISSVALAAPQVVNVSAVNQVSLNRMMTGLDRAGAARAWTLP